VGEIIQCGKFITSVSPVSLIATFENKHVIESTTYSKSVLRVAAEKIATENEDITYFPSYEIITSNFNRGSYFEEDLRSVKESGVDHVMSIFFKHFTEGKHTADEQKGEKLNREIEDLFEVVCDEEALDKGVN